MNKELLIKVRDHILAEPRRLNMSEWTQKATPGSKLKAQYEFGFFSHRIILDEDAAPPCGTVACIAGWAVALSVSEEELKKVLLFESKAADLLDLDYSDSSTLFFPPKWPEPFKSRYPLCTTQPQRAQVVADVINWFIEVNGDVTKRPQQAHP